MIPSLIVLSDVIFAHSHSFPCRTPTTYRPGSSSLRRFIHWIFLLVGLWGSCTQCRKYDRRRYDSLLCQEISLNFFTSGFFLFEVSFVLGFYFTLDLSSIIYFNCTHSACLQFVCSRCLNAPNHGSFLDIRINHGTDLLHLR